MKRILLSLILFAMTGMSIAARCLQPHDYSFYIKAGTGVSASECANICAPFPPWSPAIQGYNASLGSAPIASASIGCEICQVVDLEATISNRSIFKYRKFQTPTAGGDSYTRKFDLNITSILFAANVLGKGIPHLNWDFRCGTLYPILGIGLGSSNIALFNYRTTGLAPIGDSAPYPTFSAESQYTLRKNFTYTVLFGFEYNQDNSWAIGTGYRWFNAGSFKGPRYQRVSGGTAVDVGCDAWNMRFRANEWFIEFKIFI